MIGHRRGLAVAALVVTTLVATSCVPEEVGPRPAVVSSPPNAFDDYLAGEPFLRGVNIYSFVLAGAGADAATLGEPASSYAFLAGRGIDLVRLAVPWQRLQVIPAGGDALDGLAQPIDADALGAVVREVRTAAAAGVRTVVDLHNGCTYPWGAGEFVEGSVRCGDGITEDHVRGIWTALAGALRDEPGLVAFDVFNEPRWSVGVDTYKHFAQVGVDAIRSTGATQPVWVEGILSEERGRLTAIAPDGPWIVDPLGRVIYSEHFYADSDGARYADLADPERVLAQLTAFGDWCRRWGVRCSVGEVGWPSGGPGGAQSTADAVAWNALFSRFYDIADAYALDVTYFGATSARTVGTLLAYVASDPGIPSPSGIDTALSQAEVVEAHLAPRPND